MRLTHLITTALLGMSLGLVGCDFHLCEDEEWLDFWGEGDIEGDRDGDGLGDEFEDLCNTSPNDPKNAPQFKGPCHNTCNEWLGNDMGVILGPLETYHWRASTAISIHFKLVGLKSGNFGPQLPTIGVGRQHPCRCQIIADLVTWPPKCDAHW